MTAYLNPHLSDEPVGKITKSVLENWIQKLSKAQRSNGRVGYAPATVNKAYQKLSLIMAYAVSHGYLAESARPKLTGIPSPKNPNVDPLDSAQVTHLADIVDSRHRLVVMLGALAGLRFGGIAALRIDNVTRFSTLNGSIHVMQTLHPDGRLGPCKTKSSERTVNMGSVLTKEFIEHVKRYPASNLNTVVAAPNGGPLIYSNFRRRI